MSVNAHRGPGPPDVEAVWRDFRRPMLSFIGRRVSDRDSAEDILQDVMLRIHRHANELTKVSAVSGWIHEIARNAIIDHYRRAVVRREQPVGAGLQLELPQPAEPEPVPNEARTELAACLQPILAPAARDLPRGAPAHRPRRVDPGGGRRPGRSDDVGNEGAGPARPRPAQGAPDRLLRDRARPTRWRHRLPTPDRRLQLPATYGTDQANAGITADGAVPWDQLRWDQGPPGQVGRIGVSACPIASRVSSMTP